MRPDPNLGKRILQGDPRAAARLMTLIEENRPGTQSVLKALRSLEGMAHKIGITGPPGSGKSTLIDKLIAEFRLQNKKVGVVAVDVTSPITSGAILGDRIRMNRHATDREVFIRSMASRGQLGGLSRKTLQVMRVLEAMGKEVILIETVGVGQSEVDVARVADTTIVVMAPGLGDDIQAMKAGLLEVGDLFVINKSDLPRADEAVRFLQDALNLSSQRKGWRPMVYKTTALNGEGVKELIRGITAHRLDLVRSRKSRLPSHESFSHRSRLRNE